MAIDQSSKTKYRLNSDNNVVLKNESTLKTDWELTENHDLLAKLQASSDSEAGEKVLIRGTIKDINKHELVFEVDNRFKDNELWGNYITLQGAWQADEKNRLIFKVKKETTEHDILTFTNTWKINKHHRIVYTYEKADLITKDRRTHELKFKGYWQVDKRNRLYYEIEKENLDAIAFNVGVGHFEDKKIKYKVMVGVDPNEQSIELEGKWRVHSMVVLGFDVEYEDREVQPLTFTGELDLSDRDFLNFKVGEEWAIRLSRKIFDNASTFVGFHSDDEDPQIRAGIEWRF